MSPDRPTVYLFNPDSDLALSYEAEMRRRGLPRAIYTPKPFAVSMARSLQLLPCWYSEPGSLVLVEGTDGQVAAWQRWADGQNLRVSVVNTPPERALYRPWGWNNTIVHRLRRLGVDDPCPWVDAYAVMSSRRQTVELHHRVGQLMQSLSCEPPMVGGMDLVVDFVASHPQGTYIKKLYSGSGQGIFHVAQSSDLSQQELRQWLAGVLRRDGEVVCEPAYQRLMDMAVEFDCMPQNGIRVVGYSIFEVDRHDQWIGTQVNSREALHDGIVKHYPDFDAVVESVRQSLEAMVPRTCAGHLGVDMLLYYNEQGEVAINPCVEINFRTTMGIVAAFLGERHGLRGILRIITPDEVGPNDRPLLPIDEWPTSIPVLQSE